MKSTRPTQRTLGASDTQRNVPSTPASSPSSTTTPGCLPRCRSSPWHMKSGTTLALHTTSQTPASREVSKGTTSCSPQPPVETGLTMTSSRRAPCGTSHSCWMPSRRSGEQTASRRTTAPSVGTRLWRRARSVIVATTYRSVKKSVATHSRFPTPCDRLTPRPKSVREPGVLCAGTCVCVCVCVCVRVSE